MFSNKITAETEIHVEKVAADSMSNDEIEQTDKIKKATTRRRHRKSSSARERIIAKPLEDMSVEELEDIVGKKPKPPRGFND